MRRARKTFPAIGLVVLLAILTAVPSASAAIGLNGLGVSMEEEDGSPAALAGSHPFAVTTTFEVDTFIDPELGEVPVEALKDLNVELPVGMAGIPTATPRCSTADFADIIQSKKLPSCSDDSAVGTAILRIGDKAPEYQGVPVYNLIPSPGEAAKLGLIALGAPVTIDLRLSETAPYRIVASVENASNVLRLYGSTLTVWGNPWSSAHDEYRGSCVNAVAVTSEPELISAGSCPTSIEKTPFITSPRACEGPLSVEFEADSWQNPGAWFIESATVPAFEACDQLDFAPSFTAEPTTPSAESPSGLEFDLTVEDEGIDDPDLRAGSDIKKVEVTLPEGMTINPSQAEGLGVCTESQLAAETATSAPGEGCPLTAKIGTVEVETPLLEGVLLRGSLFVAKPYENLAGDSLIALYMTVKDPELGVAVKLAGRVVPDPVTGRLTSTFEDLPQVPFSHFHLRFHGGARSPLVTPPGCGAHTVEAVFTPWADSASPRSVSSEFQIDSGLGGGPCAAGTPLFSADLDGGTIDNAAGSYSPFYLRLTKNDGGQNLTRFLATLPPGLVGRLAGVAECPDSAIAQARGRTGPHGGEEEKLFPSCPSASRVGTVVAGAGAGPELTFVPGSVYLAGPYNGAPLSVVAIVPAIAGPFDVGTVVTRQALRIHPRTARVTVDASASDPIPRILAGIPLRARDIRVFVDRPGFMLNPTSCDPLGIGARLWGSGADLLGDGDDTSLLLERRFQATGCAGLGFKPGLKLRLKGATKRSGYPALEGVYRPPAGDANLSGLVLRLPRTTFLEQGHIRTICTRVQFAARACPEGSIYGYAKAVTPLLAEPLEGPVYLRSSDNPLPDLVASLRGKIDVEAVARIDSKNGGIRATFTEVPDAPLTEVVMRMKGGSRGLIVNSVNLCRARNLAAVVFKAHNGMHVQRRSKLITSGCKKNRAKARHHRG